MTNETTDEILDETVDTPTEQTPVELPQNEPAVMLSKNAEEPAAEEQPAEDSEKRELIDKLAAAEAELLKEQIKVKLLILGILPEKLEDGAAMAYGLCLAGKSADNAAGEIIEAYPHFKAVRRELPQFSSESAGSGDGFSAIRRIFSAR